MPECLNCPGPVDSRNCPRSAGFASPGAEAVQEWRPQVWALAHGQVAERVAAQIEAVEVADGHLCALVPGGKLVGAGGLEADGCCWGRRPLEVPPQPCLSETSSPVRPHLPSSIWWNQCLRKNRFSFGRKSSEVPIKGRNAVLICRTTTMNIASQTRMPPR